MSITSPEYPPELGVGVTSSRITRVAPAARAVHRAILRGFAATGRAPDRVTLAAAAPRLDLDVLLAELHDHDVVRLDERGRIAVSGHADERPLVSDVIASDSRGRRRRYRSDAR